MAEHMSILLSRLRRSLAADPGRFAGGSAVSDPLGLLAVQQERLQAGRAPRSRRGGQPGELDMAHRHRSGEGSDIVDCELEVVVIPVSDVDKAKDFY